MAPKQPFHLIYLYEWFNLIARARSEAAPLAWTDIDAWCRLHQTTLELWEIEVLLTLDRVWLRVCAEKGHPFEEIEDEHKAAEAV